MMLHTYDVMGGKLGAVPGNLVEAVKAASAEIRAKKGENGWVINIGTVPGLADHFGLTYQPMLAVWTTED